MNRVLTLILFCLCAGSTTAPAVQLGIGSARVTTPPVVLFEVPDVSASSVASSPTTVSFDSAILGLGQAMRISVKADGDITMPGADPIASSSVSWTTSNSMSGAAMNGTLSKVTYAPVFEGQVGATSGRVDLTWRISGPLSTPRAGTRQAALRWKFEAITP